MSKRSWSGRYLPLALTAACCAYRTMHGNPRGAFLTHRAPKRRCVAR